MRHTAIGIFTLHVNRAVDNKLDLVDVGSNTIFPESTGILQISSTQQSNQALITNVVRVCMDVARVAYNLHIRNNSESLI